MKRYLLLLLPFLITIQSCKKTEIIIPNRTIVVNLTSGSWVPLNGGKSYTTAINVFELNDFMHERGGTLVYLSFGSRTYEQIPQVYDGDSYSYVTRSGQVVLEVQRADAFGVVTPPGSMTVKIILINSDF
jgi:hypothetical protein